MPISLLNCVYLSLIVLLEDNCYSIFVSLEDNIFVGNVELKFNYILVFYIIIIFACLVS